jgi:hypothetical protein
VTSAYDAAVTIYNSDDRPRVVVLGCTEDHPLVVAVSQTAGFFSIAPLDEQPLQERDAVVAWQNSTHQLIPPDRHLRVIQFGGEPLTRWKAPAMYSYGDPSPGLAIELGDELQIPGECPDALQPLVKRSLIPMLMSRSGGRIVIQKSWGSSEPVGFTPLLTNSNGSALAAIFHHPDVAESWWLPVAPEDADSFDFVSWLIAAFEAWHGVEPDRFPGSPDWTRSTDWMTHEELRLQDALVQAETELERLHAEYAEKVEASHAALADAQKRHDAEERVLLTGQGGDLVAAVKGVLERWGFVVDDRDETKPGQKLEDLRVSDPESPWRALAEVKGYLNAGGKPRDLQQLSRFVGIYQGQEGSLPDASWYIVNQHATTAPDRRRTLMFSHPEDVDEFVEQLNGVVIDTRDLFVLDRRVAQGNLTALQARQIMMAAERRLDLSQLPDD